MWEDVFLRKRDSGSGVEEVLEDVFLRKRDSGSNVEEVGVGGQIDLRAVSRGYLL
jgi:hypothetical protein